MQPSVLVVVCDSETGALCPVSMASCCSSDVEVDDSDETVNDVAEPWLSQFVVVVTVCGSYGMVDV